MNGARKHIRQRISEFFRARGVDGPLAAFISVGAVLLFAFIKLV